jgi:hypothetical protein
MARTMEGLKQRLTEALGNAGVPSTVLAELDQVFEQHAPRESAKRAPARAKRGVKRSGAKRRKKK